MGLMHVEVVDILLRLRGVELPQVILAAWPRLVLQAVARLALLHEAQDQPQGCQALLTVDQLPPIGAYSFHDDGLQAVALACALPYVVQQLGDFV